VRCPTAFGRVLPYRGGRETTGRKIVAQRIGHLILKAVAGARQAAASPSRLVSARTLVPLALVALSFNLVIFPWRTARLRELSGVADPILDIRFSYSPEAVADVASRLGERGRLVYALSELSVDLIYPLLYGSFFGLLLLLVLRRALPSRPSLHHVALLPFAVVACDYAVWRSSCSASRAPYRSRRSPACSRPGSGSSGRPPSP
jgi:hypothetical protein